MTNIPAKRTLIDEQAVYQNPADLELGVFSHSLPAKLTIFTAQQIKLKNWHFVFHIIGESHFVKIQQNNRPFLYEVLACIPLPADQCRHHHRFTDLQPHRFAMENYTMTTEFHSGEGRSSLTDHPFTMEVIFPVIFDQTPVTRIGWRENQDGLTWWTSHLYPDQHGLTIVETVSNFNCW